MQTLRAKKNYQVESYTVESTFLQDPTFFKRIESKRETPLNLFPSPKPNYHFSEKAHPLDEYIEICDLLFLKNLQGKIEKHPSRKYLHYTIEKNDTLYGIALKFDVSPESIKNLNFLTEDSSLFPGQMISIPVNDLPQPPMEGGSDPLNLAQPPFTLNDVKEWLTHDENSLKQEEIKEDETCLEDMLLHRKSSDDIFVNERLSFKLNTMKKGEAAEIENFKYEVYYCTSYGDIKGILTINEFLLLFDPIGTTKEKNKRSLDFQVCLDLKDVVEGFLIGLPNKYCDEQYHGDEKKKDYNKDYFLEVNVSRIGDQGIEKKYGDRIKTMAAEKLPLATIFFKVMVFIKNL